MVRDKFQQRTSRGALGEVDADALKIWHEAQRQQAIRPRWTAHPMVNLITRHSGLSHLAASGIQRARGGIASLTS